MFGTCLNYGVIGFYFILINASKLTFHVYKETCVKEKPPEFIHPPDKIKITLTI